MLLILTAAAAAAVVSAAEYTVSGLRQTVKGYDEAFAMMYEAIDACEESVDISGLGIGAEDVAAIYGDILNAFPEFFYLENTISYRYHSSTPEKPVTTVRFRYKITGDELASAKKEYEQELYYIVSLFENVPTETEKALAVHDYIVSSFTYDEEQANYDVYSLFRDRRGVCQAYSLAYTAVLRELGMEAVMVTSEEMNHAWNLVKVDGSWYHTDLAFDDPAPDRPGHALHDNFLLSDESIAKTAQPHYGWTSTVKCDSPDPDGIFRRPTESAMIWLDGEWYYIDSEKLALVVADFGGKYDFELYHFDRKWYVEGKSKTYWVGVFSGVSTILDHVFVNTPDEIVIYSPRTGSFTVFLEAEEGERFFGSWVYKNTLEYMISDSPSISDETRTEQFNITNFSPEDYEPLPFEDVSRIDDYYLAVRYVYNEGLFKGVSSTKFAPEATLTRAMFVTVLGRLCGVETENYPVSRFSDVGDGLWYTPYVEWAYETGLVEGVGGGLFDPTGEITREQMLKISAALARRYGVGSEDTSGTIVLFEDRDMISDWAADSIVYSVSVGIIDSSGELRPRDKASRAEAAVTVVRLHELLGTSPEYVRFVGAEKINNF